MDSTIRAAYEAVSRGFQPIPLVPRDKKPYLPSWTTIRWDADSTLDQVAARFADWASEPGSEDNVGVLLGEPSGNLLDVDLDHYRTSRLKDLFLPPTPAVGGRGSKPRSHYWYIAKEGTLPGTRQHLMPRTAEGKRGEVIVELRSTFAQTVLPPSIHPSGELYSWSSLGAWGGEAGPAIVDGRRLAVQVALLALGTVLLDKWPTKGTRHEAYLALAGGLLRDGDRGVHEYWQQNASVLIRALAIATQDDDGPDEREKESIHTTIASLKAGKPTTGFPALAEILDEETVRQVRILVAEVESSAGVPSRQALVAQPSTSLSKSPLPDNSSLRDARDARVSGTASEDRDPLEERLGTWEPLDLDPYLTGRVRPVEPSILVREDGQALMYPGRVNMLYGSSESAKSWIALKTCIQVMESGQRAMFIDFEDEPVNTLNRLQLLGAKPDDLRFLFSYIRPEEPISPMQRNRWGAEAPTSEGERNYDLFMRAVEDTDPAIIVADGMTVLYGLHGLDTNDAVSTDIITGWLKKLTRNGRSTVIIIDHTSKGAEKGTTPIGSQHKQAMVQGTMLQVWANKQPMPGEIGEMELLVLKDRPGQVRAASSKTGQKMQHAARVTLDSTVPGMSVMRIMPPLTGLQIANSGIIDFQRSAAAEKAQKLADLHREQDDKVLSVFGGELGRQLSKYEVLVAIGEAGANENLTMQPKATLEKWQTVLDRLVGDNWLMSIGQTKGLKYELMMGGGGYDVNIDLSAMPQVD
jgi:hypothetical protein